MLHCVDCGKRLPLKSPTEAKGRIAYYCENACRQSAYRKRKMAKRNAKALREKLVKFSQKSVEWYTPAIYIKAVIQVLGSIELDTASSEQANRTIQADRYYDEAADGLTKAWKAATVFLNPPYCKIGSTSNQSRWTEKLLSEYDQGNIGQAILLVNAATETIWFQRLYRFPICFVRGRIHFDAGAVERKRSPTTGSAFIYLGDDPDRFKEVFSQFGRVVYTL